MAVWFLWTLASLPPLRGPNSEAATGTVLAAFAIIGTIVYAVSAARYWYLFRHSLTLLGLRDRLLPAAVRGDDRRGGHGRAQVARELVGVARADRARVPDHRVRRLPRVARRALQGPLPADHARAPPGGQRPLRRPRGIYELLRASTLAEVAAVLNAYWSTAAPLLARRFGARSRSSSATGSSPPSTAEATSPTMRSGPPARLTS